MTTAANIQGASKIIIEVVSGDLRVRGRNDSEEISIECDAVNLHHDENSGGPVRIQCDDDCEIKCPDSIPLEILHVDGDIDKIVGLHSRLYIEKVRGDAVLRQHIGELIIQSISGDMDIKNVEGNVAITDVQGDLQVQRASKGKLTIGKVYGDLALQEIEGDCRVEHVQGDIALTLDFRPGQNYGFNADGDIAFVLSEETNATFIMPLSSDVSVSHQFDDVISMAEDEEEEHKILRFGNGEATVTVHNASDIAFTSPNGFNMEFDLNFDLSEQFQAIESRISDSMKGFSRFIEAQATEAVASAAKALKDIKIETRTERAAERASRVKERAQRAKDRVERATERAQRRSERIQRFDRRQQQANAEPVSNEERLLILQMLQDGKISVEEAEQLLATLEGR